MALASTAQVATISGSFSTFANAWRTADAALPRNIGRPGALPNSFPILLIDFSGTGPRWEISLTRTVEPLDTAVIASGGESTRSLRLTVPSVSLPIADSNPQASTRVAFTQAPCTLAVTFYDAFGTTLATASTTVGG